MTSHCHATRTHCSQKPYQFKYTCMHPHFVVKCNNNINRNCMSLLLDLKPVRRHHSHTTHSYTVHTCHIPSNLVENFQLLSRLGIIPAMISSTCSNWKLYQNYMTNLARMHTTLAQLCTINTKEIFQTRRHRIEAMCMQYACINTLRTRFVVC